MVEIVAEGQNFYRTNDSSNIISIDKIKIEKSMIIGIYVAVTYTACGAFPRKENGFLQLSIFLSAQKINDPKIDTKDTSLFRFRENLPRSYTEFIESDAKKRDKIKMNIFIFEKFRNSIIFLHSFYLIFGL